MRLLRREKRASERRQNDDGFRLRSIQPTGLESKHVRALLNIKRGSSIHMPPAYALLPFATGPAAGRTPPATAAPRG